ncbi:hypothetical protein [Streptomyces sp. NPDC001435]|uniref:hypothetical protein n=1 Tax=unclassified Streptomyces TaxID=2593676 RepID=UPI003697776A
MEAHSNDIPELEFSTTDARAELGKLAARAGKEEEVVHLTKGGERLASMVAPHEGERVARRGRAVSTPGDVKAAALIATGMLHGDQSTLAAFDSMKSNAENFAGGIITLMGALYLPVHAQGNEGRLNVANDDGSTSVSESTMADLVISQLAARDDLPLNREALPLIAGAFWAMQLGIDPAAWRNSLNLPLIYGEPIAWLWAVYATARFLDQAAGRPIAEQIICDAAEHFGIMPK